MTEHAWSCRRPAHPLSWASDIISVPPLFNFYLSFAQRYHQYNQPRYKNSCVWQVMWYEAMSFLHHDATSFHAWAYKINTMRPSCSCLTPLPHLYTTSKTTTDWKLLSHITFNLMCMEHTERDQDWIRKGDPGDRGSIPQDSRELTNSPHSAKARGN